MKYNIRYGLILSLRSIVFLTMPACLQASLVYYGSGDLVDTTFQITATASYGFYNNAVYNYRPSAMALGSPMIKIVASDVIIDFNDIGIYNQPVMPNMGWVGIEIGWTPVELADDPSRVQPRNVTIKNGMLYNFDCGLLVHAGVEGVIVSNMKMSGNAIGMSFLGLSGSIIHDVRLNDINIKGNGKSCHDSLVSLKTLIEKNYNYGPDYFMPLQLDPLSGNIPDVYSYIGLYFNNISSLTMNKVSAQDIGHRSFSSVSEGNGLRTHAIGCQILNSRRIKMNDVEFAQMDSELKAVGLQLDNSSSVEITGGECSYNNSLIRAVGIEVTNQTAAQYSVISLRLTNVVARNNIANQVAIGMDLTSVKGLEGENLACKLNLGGQQGYGIYSASSSTIRIYNSTLSENSATRAVNDLATMQGVVSAGFYGEKINVMELDHVFFNSMNALNSAFGLYLNNSMNCGFTNCEFLSNTAIQMRSKEVADIRLQQDVQEISKHGPAVDATTTGGYGAFVKNSTYLKFQDCLATGNSGHRSAGLRFSNCQAVVLWSVIVSGQTATGFMLDSSLYSDNATSFANVAIKPIHRPLLFGNLTKSSVNLIETTDLFLQAITNIRASQVAGAMPKDADVMAMISTNSLLSAAIARYRLWSTAIGIHGHNVRGFLVKDCIADGQASYFDNGIGICFTGRCANALVRNSELSFNIGNYASLQTPTSSLSASYSNSYNLMGMKYFWETLFTTATSWSSAETTDNIGIYNKGPFFKLQGSKLFGDGMQGDNVFIQLFSANRTLVSPIGPIGAGLVLGDLLHESSIEDCYLHGNLANAGHAHGVLLDVGHSVTLKDNIISGSAANIYGMACGILDVTASSPNLYIKNFLEGNKCSTFNNANYIVPFNSADPAHLAFPVCKLQNGNFTGQAIASFDNIVVEYSLDPSFYSIEGLTSLPLHPDILSYLTTNGCWA